MSFIFVGVGVFCSRHVDSIVNLVRLIFLSSISYHLQYLLTYFFFALLLLLIMRLNVANIKLPFSQRNSIIFIFLLNLALFIHICEQCPSRLKCLSCSWVITVVILPFLGPKNKFFQHFNTIESTCYCHWLHGGQERA